MTPEAEGCIERIEYLHNEVKKELQGLTPEALNWKPDVPETNSIFALATHIPGTEAQWIHQFVGGIAIRRDRNAEFAAAGSSVEDLERLLDSTLATTKDVLGKLSQSDFDAARSPGGSAAPVTNRWAILHTIEHVAQHLGHLSLTKQLYQAR